MMFITCCEVMVTERAEWRKTNPLENMLLELGKLLVLFDWSWDAELADRGETRGL